MINSKYNLIFDYITNIKISNFTLPLKFIDIKVNIIIKNKKIC